MSLSRPKKKQIPKRPRPILGPVIVSIKGLNYHQDDSVCVCGHWASAHRRDGESVCEGFRCGCYTFRQLTDPQSNATSPKCPVCNAPVTGKQVMLDSRATSLTTAWLHERLDSGLTKHITTMPLAIEVAKDGTVMTEPVIMVPTVSVSPFTRTITTDNTSNLPELQAEPIDEDQKFAPMGLNPTKPFNPPRKIDDYKMELERIRAERNKPQRAPRVEGEIV